MKRRLPIGNSDTPPIFMAPMAGYTDLSFRRIAFKLGLGYAVTEMVSAKAMSYDDKKTLSICIADGRTGIQMFGHEPEAFDYSIKKYLNNRNDFLWLDLNFGCPAPKIFKNGDGSVLLKDMTRLCDVIRTCKRASDKPVSAKMRLGIEDKNGCVEIAKRIEDAGADFITVHGRTRDMYYSGEADWDAIFEIRRSVCVPVIGNGDIFTAERAKELLDSEEIDGIAIGRAAIGNPFIFNQINLLTGGECVEYNKSQIIKEHFELSLSEKPERVAVNDFKKHLIKYLNSRHRASKLRRELAELKTKEDMKAKIHELFDNID